MGSWAGGKALLFGWSSPGAGTGAHNNGGVAFVVILLVLLRCFGAVQNEFDELDLYAGCF